MTSQKAVLGLKSFLDLALSLQGEIPCTYTIALADFFPRCLNDMPLNSRR